MDKANLRAQLSILDKEIEIQESAARNENVRLDNMRAQREHLRVQHNSLLSVKTIKNTATYIEQEVTAVLGKRYRFVVKHPVTGDTLGAVYINTTE